MAIPHLHPDDTIRYMQVLLIAREAVRELGLPDPDITPEPFPSWAHEQGRFGCCWSDHGGSQLGRENPTTKRGRIHIVLRFQNEKGEWLGPLPAHEVFDTLAHELAHLRHNNHGKRFWDYKEECQRVVDAIRFGRRR